MYGFAHEMGKMGKIGRFLSLTDTHCKFIAPADGDAVTLLDSEKHISKHRFDSAYRELVDAIGKTEVPNKFLAALRFKLFGAIIVQASLLCNAFQPT